MTFQTNISLKNVCNQCGSTLIWTEIGERVCPNCGLVLSVEPIFGKELVKWDSLYNNPIKPARVIKKRWEKWRNCSSAYRREYLFFLDKLCDFLNFNKVQYNHVILYYRQCHHFQNRFLTMFCIAYKTAKDFKKPISLKKMYHYVKDNLNKKIKLSQIAKRLIELNPVFKRVEEKYGFIPKKLTPFDFIPKLTSTLKLSDSLERQKLEVNVIQFFKPLKIKLNNSPEVQAAAMIYFFIKYVLKKHITHKICEESWDIAAHSIAPVARKIKEKFAIDHKK